MFRRMLQLSFAILAVATITISISAQSAVPDSLTATISLRSRTQVANKTLEPGEYRVVFEGGRPGNDLCAFVSPLKNEHQVLGQNGGGIKRDGVVAAEVPCTLKTQETNADKDLAVLNQNRLTAVQFGKKAEVVEFHSN